MKIQAFYHFYLSIEMEEVGDDFADGLFVVDEGFLLN